MEFVQIIEFHTSKPEEMQALAEEYQVMRGGTGGPSPSAILIVADRDRPNTFMTIVRFASYEEAMENSKREDTTEMAGKFAALCDDPPTFRNLDVMMEANPPG